jgi:hypothetical protein
MIRPDLVGRNLLYNDPTNVSFTTAELGLIDSSRDTRTMYPYAHTATLADNEDEVNIDIAGQDIASSSKVAFGLFLSKELTKGNMLFNIQACVSGNTTNTAIQWYPFFGRTSSSTITSTKATTANELDNYII